MSRAPTGVVVWRGPSAFDGVPIQGIVHTSWKNPKTGLGNQLAIIPADEHPLDVIRAGRDTCVCDNCVLRKGVVVEGKRPCYVNLMYLNTLWKQVQNGNYPLGSVELLIMWGRGLFRIGSFGSAAAMPYEVTERLVSLHTAMPQGNRWTGYIQNWDIPKYEAFGELCMASAPTLGRAQQAWDLGWRSFRILGEGEEPTEHEVMCPHVTDQVMCLDCGLCNGNASGAKSITVPAHGPGAKYFSLVQQYVDQRAAASGRKDTAA